MEEEEDVMLKLQQRVTQLETQLAENIRQHNQEAGDLQNTVVRLRSQLEQGETERHTLEYQLTLAQKDGRVSHDLLDEREEEWSSLRTSFQDRVSKLTHQCQEWRSTLDTVQQARATERSEQQHILAEKNKELLQKTTLYQKLELEHQHLKAELASNRDSITELKSRLQHAEDELSLKNEAVLTLNHQLDDANTREEKLKKHCQDAMDRAKTLESSLESTKDALTTAQHNTEMYQHQAHELESILGNERESHEQAVKALNDKREVVNSLQSSLEREEKRCSLISEQLKRKEADCESLRQQKREKQTVIANLSHQLQLHKGNLGALKEEMNLTKQRQVLIEDSYSSSLREIDSLVNVFTSHCSSSQGVIEPHSTTDPAHLPEKLRQALMDFQSKLGDTQAQVDRLNSQLSSEREKFEQVTGECTTYRDIVTARTSAMTDAELRLNANSQKISRLNSELTQSQVAVLSLQNELDTLAQRAEKSQTMYRESAEELSALKKKYTMERDIHCNYLHSLLDRLSPSKSKNSQGSSSENNATSDLPHWGTTSSRPHLQWDNLSAAVNTTTVALSEALKQTKRELKQVKSTNNSLNSMLESVDALHKESTQKLTVNIEEQERQWTQRTCELKNHYDAKLVEAEQRCLEFEGHVSELKREVANISAEKDHCETMLSHSEQQIQELNQTVKERADKVSSLNHQIEEYTNREKVVSQLNQQLESQLSQLQEVHRGYKNDRACLLACTCLLVGSLFPALRRVQDLTVQQTNLLKQLSACNKFHAQVCELVTSIQTDVCEPQNQNESSQLSGSSSASHPLLRFRKVVIVVLAANRLLKFRKRSKFLFSLDLPSWNYSLSACQHHLSVHIGHRYLKSSKQKQSPEALPSHQRPLTNDIASWLRSEKVLSDVRDSFSDLQATLDSCTSHQSKQSTSHSRSFSRSTHKTSSRKKLEQDLVLVNPTRDCFGRLLQKMSLRFEENSSLSHAPVSLSVDYLCCRLGRGLECILKRLPSLHGYIGSTELGECLHAQLAHLVGRLHKVEVERHSLLLQLDQSKSEQDRLSGACQEALEMESQVEKLRNNVAGMVSHETFMAVCGDLEVALKREQELKVSLTQHGVAVKQLQERLQLEGKNLQANNDAMSVVDKELSELRVNLQHKEQQLREMSKQLHQANKERVQQAQQLGELQSSLTTCRRQISIAHAAVAAESSKPSMSNRTEPNRDENIFSTPMLDTVKD